MDDDALFAATTRNRICIADLLDGLDVDRWSAPSLCEGWAVRHVAAHLLQPSLVGFGRFFLVALRYRGDTDATIDHLARRLARREPPEIVALLRAHRHDRVAPPRVGPWGPFAETCIHLRDIVRPLGLDVDVPREDWAALLGHLTSGNAAPSLTPRGRATALAFCPTDIDGTYGTGEPVTGTAEALAMALAGRPAALADLTGPGATILRERLTGPSTPRRSA